MQQRYKGTPDGNTGARVKRIRALFFLCEPDFLLRGFVVLKRLLRVVNVIRFDDQRDRNVLTIGPGLSNVLL